jgi:hypothetical protein
MNCMITKAIGSFQIETLKNRQKHGKEHWEKNQANSRDERD